MLFVPNTARSAARELQQPAQWTDPVAQRVYARLMQPGALVDMFLVGKTPRPLCTTLATTPVSHQHGPECAICTRWQAIYGDRPHVIAYCMWDDPRPSENAETYIVRHMDVAMQKLGGVPHVRAQ